MTFRVYLALGSGAIAIVALCLVPVAYFGDKNAVWTKRLIVLSFVAALLFLLDLLL